MAGDTVIIVAQAPTGEVTGVPVAPAEEHAAETHATTEDHGGDHGGVFPPFDPATFGSQLIWLALTFGALYVVMSRMALPRIGGILEQRESRITGDLREAERLRQETEKAVASYEAALAEARTNAQQIAQETRESIRVDIEGKRAAVEADLAAKVSAAEQRVAATKNAVLANVDDIAAETAAALVGRLTGDVALDDARAAVRRVGGTA